MGAIHPIFVHFPIALLIVGTGGWLWRLLRKPSSDENPLQAANWDGFISGVLGLGYLSLLVTVITGLFDMLSSPKALARPDWIVTAVLHIVSAVPLVVIYGIVLYRRFFSTLPETDQPAITVNTSKTDRLLIGFLILGLILILITGWFGGRLVYDYRVGVG